MRVKFVSNYLLILTIITSLSNCSKKEDIPTNLKINNFIWKGLNAHYFWQSKVNDLSDRKFSSQAQINDYLKKYENPVDLFNGLLYQKETIDKYSSITDDYIKLENSIQGISLSNGMKFDVLKYKSDNKLYGYVNYVTPDSDADKKGIKRGMIFNQIDKTFISEGNYTELMSKNSYSITLADYNNGDPSSNGKIINLTKTQLQENPILVSKIIESNSKKIGYLVYNHFTSSFDDELNTEFAKYKSNGVSELIIDLRYNNGGSMSSAAYLGSMITGQFKGQLFAKQVWNEKYMNVYGNSENLRSLFTDKIVKNNGNIQQPINSLFFNKVYFIVSKKTASTAELLINCLKPYIKVFLVGNKTLGKHMGTMTLYDSDDYTKNGPNFNTSHTWAMQPIVLETQNKNGKNEPEGHTPNAIVETGSESSKELGDVTEVLLAETLKYIKKGTTTARYSTKSTDNHLQRIGNSDELNPNYNKMYVDFID